MADVDAKASEARSTMASHLEAPQQVYIYSFMYSIFISSVRAIEKLCYYIS